MAELVDARETHVGKDIVQYLHHYRFESCPDNNELITQIDVCIYKHTDILLGVGKSVF